MGVVLSKKNRDPLWAGGQISHCETVEHGHRATLAVTIPPGFIGRCVHLPPPGDCDQGLRPVVPRRLNQQREWTSSVNLRARLLTYANDIEDRPH